MQDIRFGRDLMARAEEQIREACAPLSPGERASNFSHAYGRLSSEVERVAFVAVLASKVAVLGFVGASPAIASPSAYACAPSPARR